MHIADHTLEIQKSQKHNELFINLLQVFGEKFKFERFNAWVGQYQRVSRDFHGPDHMYAMSELDPGLPGKAAHYSMVAGFFHDEDYPSISEEITYVSKKYLDKYVEEKSDGKYAKKLQDGDKVGQIIHEIFGFKEEQKLSPFPFKNPDQTMNPGGINEFYCAVAAACESKSLGKDNKFIAAITACIEATIPFRGPTRMNDLRERVEKTNDKLSLGLTKSDVDEIMVACTHIANKDVSSFLGGLNPQIDSVPTTLSVVKTIKGGDSLSPEEVVALRTKDKTDVKPGETYSVKNFLDARIKRAGLYHLVLTGDKEKGAYPNLFYETKLSDGSVYPPSDWTAKANKLAYENNQPVKTAQFARLISSAIIYSVVESCGNNIKGTDVIMKDVVEGLEKRMPPQELSENAPRSMKLAFACVSGRAESNYDVRRSPFAELILSRLSEEKVEELGKKTRDLMLPEPKPEEYLKLVSEYLGKSLNIMRNEMVKSAKLSGNHVLEQSIRSVELPKINEIS